MSQFVFGHFAELKIFDFKGIFCCSKNQPMNIGFWWKHSLHLLKNMDKYQVPQWYEILWQCNPVYIISNLRAESNLISWRSHWNPWKLCCVIIGADYLRCCDLGPSTFTISNKMELNVNILPKLFILWLKDYPHLKRSNKILHSQKSPITFLSGFSGYLYWRQAVWTSVQSWRKIRKQNGCVCLWIVKSICIKNSSIVLL